MQGFAEGGLGGRTKKFGLCMKSRRKSLRRCKQDSGLRRPPGVLVGGQGCLWEDGFYQREGAQAAGGPCRLLMPRIMRILCA